MTRLHSLLLSGLLLVGQIWAKHWHEDQVQWDWESQHGHHDGGRSDLPGKDCYFSPHDVRLISDYYPSRYPPLPPGLEKKFRRNSQLPPRWENRLQLLPIEVEHQLVPVPTELRRGVIDGFAVVYSPQSGMIIDVTVLFGVR